LETVSKFVLYILEIAQKAKFLMTSSWAHELKLIRQTCDAFEKREKKPGMRDLLNSSEMIWKRRARCDSIEEEVNKFLSIIPVISFNGQRYDLNVLKPELMHCLNEYDTENSTNAVNFAVRRNSSLMCFQTDSFRFLDITNFIGPGQSYSSYLTAFGVEESKGFFPYEWFDDLSKLQHPCLPKQEDFYSKLKQEHISTENYRMCERIWDENGMKSMKDFLIWYNNKDVVPFLEAIEAQTKIYKEKGIDLLKSAISLPGAAVHWMMKTTDHSRAVLSRDTWNDFQHNNNDLGLRSFLLDQIPVMNISSDYDTLYHRAKKNMVGGPSIVFHRFHERGKTFIRENDSPSEAKPCHSIQGFDANALYVDCINQNIPVGVPVIEDYNEQGVLQSSKRATKFGWSQVSHTWLAFISCMEGTDIQHFANSGEKRLGRHGVFVDGYCAETMTVYEFMGCYWHGHECITRNESLEEERLRRRSFTEKKIHYLRELGYNVEVIWECEWRAIRFQYPECNRFCEIFEEIWYPKFPALGTLDSVIRSVTDETFFGFVVCDIHVPDELYDKFSEMCPIFGHETLDASHLSSHMKDFVDSQEFQYNFCSSKSLISSMSAKEMMIHSELLKWYLDEGLVVTRIYETYRFNRKRIFAPFVDEVTSLRRQGDKNSAMSLIANMAKLSGNSIYGKTITNKEKHRKTSYLSSESNISREIASKHFIGIEELGCDMFELTHFKKSIDMNIPVSVGFVILQLAKKKMLDFYFRCIDKFLDRKDFQYMEMDTDSAYMALSAPFLQCIKPSLLQEFIEEFPRWFPRAACSEHEEDFNESLNSRIPWSVEHECCKAVAKFDARTPGLFKEEFAGTGMVALNSKTYVCWNDDSGVSKNSCKGIDKRKNCLTSNEYRSVLETRLPVSGTNTGIIKVGQQMMSYSMKRAGLTYFYIKRNVCEDGISTTPLPITLDFSINQTIDENETPK
jgi:G:T-mismatch repair DNA endonuclease (very short patch repair protein)